MSLGVFSRTVGARAETKFPSSSQYGPYQWQLSNVAYAGPAIRKLAMHEPREGGTEDERVASVGAYASGKCRLLQRGTRWLAVKIPELPSATTGGWSQAEGPDRPADESSADCCILIVCSSSKSRRWRASKQLCLCEAWRTDTDRHTHTHAGCIGETRNTPPSIHETLNGPLLCLAWGVQPVITSAR